MMKRLLAVAMAGSLALLLGGCVTSGTYEKKEQEAKTLETNLQALRQQYADLGKENEGLKGEVSKLNGLKEKLTGERDTLAKEKGRLEADKADLEKVLKAKSDTLSQNIVELRQKVAELQGENGKLQETIAKLKEDIANLQKTKEEEVQKTSKTYEDLLDKMKGEISKGEVTISELKGKLTVNMVEAILFDSGKAVVKPEGLKVLQKVVDILKGVKDKMIRIEGHTDNVPIHTAQFPSNWELSAARAINVTRFLQQQGIDPTLLAAVGYG
ncbi:MAG TPA: OmpA family protein, partial [Geobacteraceae bacterium]